MSKIVVTALLAAGLSPVCAQESAASAAQSPAVGHAAAPMNETRAVIHPASCMQANYPKEAHALGQQGDALVAFTITADGSVKNPVVRRTSGYAQLDAASLDSVAPCRFTPATRDGKAVESRATLAYSWRLED